jgi:hypothetical protein
MLIFLFSEAAPFLAPDGAPPPPVELVSDSTRAEASAFLGSQFAQLPAWVQIWMHFQDVIMAGLLFFVLWQRGAQVYGLCVVASHMLVYIWVAAGPIHAISLELAAFSHWLWAPALLFFVREWSKIEGAPAYKTWVVLAIGQIVFALIFDIPDGLAFLGLLFSS